MVLAIHKMGLAMARNEGNTPVAECDRGYTFYPD